MKSFIQKHKKSLATLLVAVGVSVTPIPSAIWTIAAPLIVDGVAEVSPE